MLKTVLFTTLLALGGAAAAHAQTHQPDAHSHAHATHHETVIPAQRWTPDGPLREGMRRVRESLDALGHYEHEHLNPALALQRVRVIQEAVTFMYANCRLPEEPDHALHGILVPLLAAAQKLEADPQDLQQIEAMRQAVAPYPLQFDDPGWPAESAAPAHDY